MPLERVLFSALFLFLTLSLLIIRHRFDFFSLYSIGILFYFSPLLFGELPDYQGRYSFISISKETYYFGIFSLCFTVLLFYVKAFFFSRQPAFNAQIFPLNLPHIYFLIFYLTIIILLLANLFLISEQMESLFVEKRMMMSHNNRLYNLWVYPTIVVGTLAIMSGKSFYFLFALTLLAVDLLLFGMRVHISLLLIIYWMFELNKNGEGRIIDQKKSLFEFSLIFVFLLIYKSLSLAFLNNSFSMEFLLQLDETIFYWFKRFESFNVMAILDSHLIYEHRTEPLKFLDLLAALLIPGEIMGQNGASLRHYNHFASLYPNLPVGAVGSSFYAEIYAYFGIPGMYLVGALFALLVFFISTAKLHKFLFSCIFVIAPVLLFYFHRNDIYFIVLMSERLLKVFLFILLINYLMTKINWKSA